MIKLKRLLEVQLIKEALPLDMAKRYTSIEQNPDMKAQQDNILDFLKQQPGAKVSRRGDRVAVPFTSDVPVGNDRASDQLILFFKNIEKRREAANAALRNTGQSFHGYPSVFSLVMPTIKDQYGRDIKPSKYIAAVVNAENLPIGRRIESYFEKDPETGKEIFTKRAGEKIPADEVRANHRKLVKQEIEELIKQYSEIPEVQDLRNSKPKTYYIVFSKHAYDVAGMSTGRGWTSCMNLYDGSNKRFVSFDVIEGTMVAYLVREDDLNIKKPAARVAIKPYVNYEDPADVLYEPEGRVYGTAPADFAKQVNELITAAQPSKTGTFSLVDTLYCDSKSSVTRFGDPKLIERCEELIAARKQATTVDEAKYMIQKYCMLPGSEYRPTAYGFSESDGIYVETSRNVVINNDITYSPVKFQRANMFNISNPNAASLKTFPLNASAMDIQLPNIRNFEGMPTQISSFLQLHGYRGDNFNGLQQGLIIIYIRTYNDSHESVIKSFDGIPATVNEIRLDKSTIVDMTIDELIEQLKPIQLTTFSYPVIFRGNDAILKDKLARSMAEWLNKIPPAVSKQYGEIPNSQYNRMIWQISQQLPTIKYLFSSRIEGAFWWNGNPLPDWVKTMDRDID